MNGNEISLINQLSDRQLLAQVKLLAQREREATAALIAHLAVLDERGLYLGEGCSSLFTYCLQVLHFSEHAAYKRIEVARASRKYPIILELLGNGSVNLTTVILLAPHLTLENHVGLLTAAKHQRKRQVEELVAVLRPLPAVPPSIRRLPAPKCASAATCAGTGSQAGSDVLLVFQSVGDVSGTVPVDVQPRPPVSPVRRAVVQPLAPERYKVQFTATAEMHEKLRRAQALMRHQIPDGDLAVIFNRALTVLLEQLTKQKQAATDRPRNRVHERLQAKSFRSRYIPAQVKRAVWQRDGGQCAFISTNGCRCDDRGFLEFHHLVPYSEGGAASIDNIQLRCRAHNNYEFKRPLGRSTMLEVREVSLAYEVRRDLTGNSLQSEFGCLNFRNGNDGGDGG